MTRRYRYKTLVNAARAYGRANGYEKRLDGIIYREGRKIPLYWGWRNMGEYLLKSGEIFLGGTIGESWYTLKRR